MEREAVGSAGLPFDETGRGARVLSKPHGHSREGGNPFAGRRGQEPKIQRQWIPAFPGMTVDGEGGGAIPPRPIARPPQQPLPPQRSGRGASITPRWWP